nr:MAG TPA: hypothetical protein [Caudoviricetes sp.]
MRGILAWVTIGRLSCRLFLCLVGSILADFGFGVTLGVTVWSDKIKS